MAVFMIGFFTTRVGNRAAVLALVVAVSINVYLALNWLGLVPAGWGVGLDEYWVGPLINVLFAAVAYGASLLIFPRGKETGHSLAGLTVWTIQDSEPKAR